MAPPETEQLLTTALGHHRAGRLPEAEVLYRRILAADPNHVMGLQFLGLLAHQVGRNDAAIELMGKAIAVNGRIPDCHFYIGVVFQVLGRLDEAAAHFSRAIALKGHFAEACYELANVRARQRRFAEAAAQYRRAVALQPNFVEALTNLGNVLLEQGARDEAVALWRRALALRPHYPVALMNIGLALRRQGKLDEAAAQFRRVLAVTPDYAEAHHNLGTVFEMLGRCGEAGAAYRRALVHKPDFHEPLDALVGLLLAQGDAAGAVELAKRALAARETPRTKSLLASCLCSCFVRPDRGDVRDLLVRALSEPWGRPADLAPTSIRFLELNEAIRASAARAAAAWPNLLPAAEFAGPGGLAELAGDRLLCALLESTPVAAVGLERLATGLRFILLTAARAEPDSTVTEPVLKLYCAIARQCFINNYVFAQSDAEIGEVRSLRDALAAALASGSAVAALTVVAVASYLPLHSLPGAAALLDRPWPDCVAAVLAQQVRAPFEEQALRATMPALTTIADEVSVAVRGHYEESPYPQWVKLPASGTAETVDRFIRKLFPLSPFIERGASDGPEILVAGCGTGQQAIEIALQFEASRVLAVDLSLTSLCYAQRQTRALGLDRIHYAQADIMRLPTINRTFDMIVASGVLHHLADPFAGWRGLVSMLRPGGLMFLGLYSETARRDIAAAQEFIRERGYRPTAGGIRRSRQELLEQPGTAPGGNVAAISDFYSADGCRDLLFHVCEHRLTLPRIAAFLADNGLQFLGFMLDALIRRNYARQFPADAAMTDLSQWHRYETANPATFIGMYQFWVQKHPA